MKFGDVQIGAQIGPEQLFVSKDQTRRYARACGLEAARFTSDEAARGEGLPGMILPGNMSLGILTKLVTDWIGSNAAKLVRIATIYRVPVLPDQTLTLSGLVTYSDPELRRCEIDIWIEGEDAERLVTGSATVEFAC